MCNCRDDSVASSSRGKSKRISGKNDKNDGHSSMNNRYEQDKSKKCYGLVREIQSCTYTNEIRGISLSNQISVFRRQTQARFILIREIRYVTRTQAASQQIFF